MDESRPEDRSRCLRNLPELKVGAEWAVDSNFNAAEELLRDPTLKDVIKSAVDEGSAIVNQND